MKALQRLWCRVFGHHWKEMGDWHDEGSQLHECTRCGDVA